MQKVLGRFSLVACLLASVVYGCARQPSASKAYLSYRAVVDTAQALDEIEPFLARTPRAKMQAATKEERVRAFKVAKVLNGYLDVSVSKESVDGERATLEVTGTSDWGDDSRANVVLVQEDGAWKVEKETWSKDASGAQAPDKGCAELAVELKGAPRVRAKAAAGLFQKTSCLEAVGALVDTLDDPRGGIRSNAAGALAGILSGADPAQRAAQAGLAPRLVAAKAKARQADDLALELALQRALAALGRPALPQLVEDLKHPSRDMRYGAAIGLGGLEGDAKEALPALRVAAQAEQDELTREAMQGVLARIGR